MIKVKVLHRGIKPDQWVTRQSDYKIVFVNSKMELPIEQWINVEIFKECARCSFGDVVDKIERAHIY